MSELKTDDWRRGEWITISKGERGYSASDFRCSICGKPNPCYMLTAYCPNCGVKMERRRDEN